MAKTSRIWDFFVPTDSFSAVCRICNKRYSNKGRGTTSLKNHLRSMHLAEYKKLKENLANEDLEITSHAQKQVTLKESFENVKQWNSHNAKQRSIEKLITEMIALQDLPFSFVERYGFRRLIKELQPKFVLKQRNFFKNNLCDNIYPVLAEKVKALLQAADCVSFTTDIWSEPSAGVSLLSLTCHLITEQFKRDSFYLKCENFKGRHTGDIIGEKLVGMIGLWNIPKNKIHCIIRDGGSNMKRALSLANIPDLECTVHRLQLCVKTALQANNLKSLVNKCKKIATHFNHSTIAQQELKEIQEFRLKQTSLSVIQECPTRWNSTFYMMEKLHKIKDSLSLYSNEHEIEKLMPQEWNDVEICVNILKPVEEATQILSSSHTCISSVIPLLVVLKTSLNQELEPGVSQEVRQFAENLHNEISLRFDNIKNNNFYVIATYLDPRYKLNFFNEIEKTSVMTEVLRLVSNEDEDIEFDQRPAKKLKTTHHDVTDFQLGSLLDELLSDQDHAEVENKNGCCTHTLTLLLQRYNEAKRIDRKEDPLLWWKNNEIYKPFYNIVRQYLSPPPGSIPSEQLFSKAGLIYDPTRCSLLNETAAKILFVKSNLPVVEFEY